MRIKEGRTGRAGKRLSKHLQLDNKNPQLHSPRKIHTYWIKATSDSRNCALDVSEQKTYSLELTDGLPRHSLSDSDKVTKDGRSVFRLCHVYLKQNTHSPKKTRMDSSKHSEAICIRDARQESPIFSKIFPDKKCTL